MSFMLLLLSTLKLSVVPEYVLLLMLPFTSREYSAEPGNFVYSSSVFKRLSTKSATVFVGTSWNSMVYNLFSATGGLALFATGSNGFCSGCLLGRVSCAWFDDALGSTLVCATASGWVSELPRFRYRMTTSTGTPMRATSPPAPTSQTQTGMPLRTGASSYSSSGSSSRSAGLEGDTIRVRTVTGGGTATAGTVTGCVLHSASRRSRQRLMIAKSTGRSSGFGDTQRCSKSASMGGMLFHC